MIWRRRSSYILLLHGFTIVIIIFVFYYYLLYFYVMMMDDDLIIHTYSFPCICRGLVDSSSHHNPHRCPHRNQIAARAPLPSIMTYIEFVHAKSIVASAATPFVANSSNTPGISNKPTVSPSFTFLAHKR